MNAIGGRRHDRSLANGIAPAAIAPGTLGGDALAFAFPIISVSDTNILHIGGISLTQDATVLSLTEFDIDLVSLTLLGLAMLSDTVVGVLLLFDVNGTTPGTDGPPTGRPASGARRALGGAAR